MPNIIKKTKQLSFHILAGLVIAAALFLLAQLTVIAIWKTVQKRSKKDRFLYQHDGASPAMSYVAPTLVYGQMHGSVSGNSSNGNAADTLGKLYDSGMTGRYGQ